jgi:outer membrane protein OmpA-like peptidoglycan-associated protein/opacity protein-like surface antigen
MKQLILKILWISLVLFMVTASPAQHMSGQLGLGFQAGLIKLVGDEVDHSIVDYASGIFLKYSFSEILTSEITASLGWVRPRDPNSQFKVKTDEPYRTYLYPWSVSLRYNLRPEKRLIPYFGIGVGLTHWDLRDVSEEDDWIPIPPSGTSVSEKQKNLTVLGMIGASLFITNDLGMDFGVRYSRLLDQTLDNIGTGDVNDGLIEIRFNLGYFFGGYRDSDGDGIEDSDDGAPYQPEDIDFFQDEDGVPDLDNDNDGIPDEIDQAPNLPEDIDGFQDNDGLPDLDDDNDGIEDSQDQCPLEPEDYDGFQDEDGCPDPDNDQDGILDTMDRCPNEPENFNGYQDGDGCPDETPESPLVERGKSLILPGVTFATGRAELTENARIILDTVFESLRDNPEIRVEIRGYTDNTGRAATNLNLSQRRAEAVRSFLVMKGITSDRLRAIGYGEANPIASNDSIEGRAKNRRIEFVRGED